MSTSSFVATISIESDEIPNPPPVHSEKSIRVISPREADPPTDLEMYPIRTANLSLSIPMDNFKAKSTSGFTNKAEPKPHSTSSPPGHASEQIQTLWNPYKNRFRVLASCMTAFGNGMNDSAPGALIASIEKSVLLLHLNHVTEPRIETTI